MGLDVANAGAGLPRGARQRLQRADALLQRVEAMLAAGLALFALGLWQGGRAPAAIRIQPSARRVS